MSKKLFALPMAAIVVLMMALAAVSCGDEKNNPTPDSSEIVVTLPATVNVVKGEAARIDGNNNIQTSDVVLLEESGKLVQCAVTEAAADHFCFKLPENFAEGTYKMYVRRGDRRPLVGTISIVYISRVLSPANGATIYGVVESDQGPVAGVVVSDGVDIVVTDNDGVYQFPSKKEIGFVFISVPSGYECKQKGVFPDHYRVLNGNNQLPERHDFTLKKVNQSNYRLLFFGDMHLGNRGNGKSNNDMGQFPKVAKDINNYVNAHKDMPVYGITLGDMTWDLYWFDKSFDPSNYATYINEQITSGLAMYHTIGNHDNNMCGGGLWGATGSKNPFIKSIAPAFYSFNIGGVHYIVLDDVDTSKYIAGNDAVGKVNRLEPSEGGRQYPGVVYNPQFAWLAKDLSYVDKSTPVVLMMHVPLFQNSSPDGFVKNMTDTDNLIAALDGFQEVHFVTGHTHRSHTVVPQDAIMGGKNIYEHNPSALCSDWWWSGAMTPGLLQASDGTPSGYGVWTVSGKNMQWLYKCVGKDENFQMRTYDLNKIQMTLESEVPLLAAAQNKTSVQNEFKKLIKAYDGSQTNVVYINVWAQNSRWTVNVKTKDGQELPVSHISAYDPVQVHFSSGPRWNSADTSSAPIGTAQNRHHFYKVTAPDATTDLVITVKDEFGHTWTETMERPKAFDLATYRIDM